MESILYMAEVRKYSMQLIIPMRKRKAAYGLRKRMRRRVRSQPGCIHFRLHLHCLQSVRQTLKVVAAP
ncbi:unnamed protein product [Cylicostephanus goldi]|uniref:Uncharacterized protein n=1 Tax=Cylicostephanus goldi TaxID=71465 RepID=A0A3P6RLB9_CYLGO|nr:unnamed protein product [Cylicostephanus goldi]